MRFYAKVKLGLLHAEGVGSPLDPRASSQERWERKRRAVLRIDGFSTPRPRRAWRPDETPSASRIVSRRQKRPELPVV
jgi:hypothetical protein